MEMTMILAGCALYDESFQLEVSWGDAHAASSIATSNTQPNGFRKRCIIFRIWSLHPKSRLILPPAIPEVSRAAVY